MPKIIKHGAIHNDNWILLSENDNFAQLPAMPILFSLDIWQARRSQLLQHAKQNSAALGLCLESNTEPELIRNDLPSFALLAINFEKFSDGRAYSLAVLLRQRMKYQGELRAIGDVLRDQLFFLRRVGFDSFVLRADQNLNEALASFADFNVAYQESVNNLV